MESKNFNSPKVNRTKFFYSLSTGILSYLIIKSIPFSFLRKGNNDKKVTIEINPDAVSRTKIGEKNV